MFRLLSQSVAAGSLVLLLATAGLWARGYWVGDEIFLTTYTAVRPDVPDPYLFEDDSGYSGERPLDREARKEREARDRSRRRANCLYWVCAARGGICLTWVISDLSYSARMADVEWTSYRAPELPYGSELARQTFNDRRWGFMRVDRPFVLGGTGGSRDAHRETTLLLPFWAPAVLFAIAPFFWLKGVYHRQRRASRWRRQGRCVGCGYDLRASVERCPECGRAMDAASSVSTGEPVGPMASRCRELLPLGTGVLLLLVIGGGVYFPLRARFLEMVRLQGNDALLEAASNAAEAAIKTGDADALRSALAVGSIYGPKETAQLIRRLAEERQNVQIRVLIENGADVRQLPGAILHEALLNRNYELARLLIEKGADVNARGELDNRPPLACCLAWGDSDEAREIMALLLEKGADPEGRADANSWTILHQLVHGGETLYPHRVRTAEMLIAKGADVNARADEDEMTPLGLASDEADPLVRLLTAKGGRREGRHLRGR